LQHWSAPVDLYCERVDASFWAEPVNALTNAAFLIAAAVAYGQWRAGGGRDRPALALILLTAVVGAGSFIFHTFATRGAALFDTIPIAVFIYGYLLLALRRFLSLSLVWTLVLLAAFAAASQALAAVVPRHAQRLALLFAGARRAARDRGAGVGTRAAHAAAGGRGVYRLDHVPQHRHRGLRCFPARHAFPVARAERRGALPAAARGDCRKSNRRGDGLAGGGAGLNDVTLQDATNSKDVSNSKPQPSHDQVWRTRASPANSECSGTSWTSPQCGQHGRLK